MDRMERDAAGGRAIDVDSSAREPIMIGVAWTGEFLSPTLTTEDDIATRRPPPGGLQSLQRLPNRSDPWEDRCQPVRRGRRSGPSGGVDVRRPRPDTSPFQSRYEHIERGPENSWR